MAAVFGDSRLPERFWAKVEIDPESGCWLWTASKKRNGYAQFNTGGKSPTGHRVSYNALIDPTFPAARKPGELVLDHLCRSRACVNPNHLEVVSSAENTRRGRTGDPQRSRTHCPHGHRYDEENTRWYRDGRHCRTCSRERGRRRHAERMAAQGGYRPERTHCVKGHPYSEENTYRHRGKRQCRTCRKAAMRRYYGKDEAAQ